MKKETITKEIYESLLNLSNGTESDHTVLLTCIENQYICKKNHVAILILLKEIHKNTANLHSILNSGEYRKTNRLFNLFGINILNIYKCLVLCKNSRGFKNQIKIFNAYISRLSSFVIETLLGEIPLKEVKAEVYAS